GAGRGRRVRTPGRSTAARASGPVPSGGPREPEAGCPASVQPRGSTSSYESVVRLEQFLHAGLVLRDLLARLSPRHREQNLAAESVTCEVDRDRELRPRAVSDRLDPDRSVCPDRSVEHPERRLPRRVVLGDLVGHRAVASRHAPCFLHTRADPERSVVLGLHGDDLFLPFAMAFDVVEVREHLLGPSVDLDALADRRHPCLLLRTIEPDPRCSGPGGSIRVGLSSSAHLRLLTCRGGDGRMSASVEARGVRKEYGDLVAVEDLTFGVERGQILGVLGPNGAGKTTAIRVLTTILAPTRGTFVVAGVPHMRPADIRRRIGVLPESAGYPERQTGEEYLRYHARLYGQSKESAREVAHALLAEAGLSEGGRSPIGTYSRGMRQRLGIARALVNEPQVVFLDE